MRPKTIVLLALALGCGLAASIGISQVMEANSRSGDLETAPIFVALTNINLGDPISSDMVVLEEWPASKVPAGAIADIGNLEGRRARTTIISGTPILEPQLLAMGEHADPVANIPDGYRLSTISVNAEKSAAGLLSPGDRVDVQLFVKANPREGIVESKTRLILENVRVFAVEQVVQRSAEGDEAKTIPKTVSLLVLPQQASKIALAQNLGELSLIPRNPNDESAANFNEITASELLENTLSINSRARERGTPQDTDSPSVWSRMMGLIKAVPPTELATFKMEIVEADAVREMLFDAKTDKPIRDQPESRPTPATPVSSPTISEGTDTRTEAPELEDFPITLEEE